MSVDRDEKYSLAHFPPLTNMVRMLFNKWYRDHSILEENEYEINFSPKIIYSKVTKENKKTQWAEKREAFGKLKEQTREERETQNYQVWRESKVEKKKKIRIDPWTSNSNHLIVMKRTTPWTHERSWF